MDESFITREGISSAGSGGDRIEKGLVAGMVYFGKPEPEVIRKQGLYAVDMHYHTNHSDSPTRVKDALKLAAERTIGLAITDHNTIGGVLEAAEARSKVLLIPGIEISAADGPHILVYFYSVSGMAEYYARFIRDEKRESPYLAIRLTTEEILASLEEVNCVVSAAHPYGYHLLVRGVQKGIEAEYLPKEVIASCDALEVICGNMTRQLNRKAAELARTADRGITGGTDGHLLADLGEVVTCSGGEDTESFLDAIVRRRNIVIGREKGPLRKGLMGTVVATRYLKYLVPSLQVHYEQNAPRIRHHFIRRGINRQKREERR
jgi:predicted metal-dependent phosphoesterase TrpH